MAAKLDYRWHLRKVMADRGMFQTTDLIGPLAQRPCAARKLGASCLTCGSSRKARWTADGQTSLSWSAH
jgi:hypothetical protein